MSAGNVRRRASGSGASDLTIRHSAEAGALTASVNPLGGGLRKLDLDGVDFVETYPPGEPAAFRAGAVLFPWPDRVRGGRWSQGDVQHQLAVNEPAYDNANHGLVLNTHFTVDRHASDEVTLSTSVKGRPGYPFAVHIRLTYRLSDDGLTITTVISNRSTRLAPVGLGAHPYLKVGDVPTAELTVRIPAENWFPLDAQFIPSEPVPVAGTAVDFRAGRRLGSDLLHVAFGDVTFDGGRTTYSLAAPDGRLVELWADDNFGYVKLYMCPAFGDGAGSHRAVAIEPMTCAVDAFNSGRGLRWLAPHETWRLSWGLRAG